MGRPRGLQDTGTTQLPLSDGDWVEVRNQISAGDRDAAYEAAYEDTFSVEHGLRVKLNRHLLFFAQVAVHITAWSFEGHDGKPIGWPPSVEKRVAVLRALDHADWDEVRTAVDAHVKAMDAAYAAKKKTPTTGTNAASSSPSAS